MTFSIVGILFFGMKKAGKGRNGNVVKIWSELRPYERLIEVALV